MATGWPQLLTLRRLCAPGLLTLCLISTVAAQCPRTHRYVGFSGEFFSFEHNFGGTIHIVDDCTFMVTNYTYDGLGPSVAWYGAPSVAAIDADGFQIVDGSVEGAANNENVTLTLRRSTTWDQIGAVLLWCKDFDANFGHVELRAATPAQQAAAGSSGKSEATAAAAAPPPARRPPPGPPPLENCAPLTGRFRVHWQLDNADPARATSIRMALEARIPTGHWMGFGFNSPDLEEVQMTGSDVVVAGMTGTLGFAIDYYLNAQRQCNYASGGDVGACPDNSQTNTTTSNQVRLLSYSNDDGVIRVDFTRPLNASDATDNPWIVTEARPITWAMGPLSEVSTAALPVVLYHQINGEAINAPRDYQLNLGQPQFDCLGAIGGSSAREVGGNVSTLANVTSFNVTTGPNPNYPAPPAWGLSYHLNGYESPLIRVMRGTEYTFNIMASAQHPFYLTTSGIGGAGRANITDETVFAGGADSHGTAAEPFTLMWTPNATTPDSLYYQCFTHQKLGWKVEVYDAGDAAGLVSNTTAAPTAAVAESAAAPASPDTQAGQPAAGPGLAAAMLVVLVTATAAACG